MPKIKGFSLPQVIQPCDDSFCWLYSLQATSDTIVIADSGNNRVSLWKLAV